VLEWEDRYKIAVGICKAFVYLHDGSPRPVIHMNVKPSNILLSHDLHPHDSLFIKLKSSSGRFKVIRTVVAISANKQPCISTSSIKKNLSSLLLDSTRCIRIYIAKQLMEM